MPDGNGHIITSDKLEDFPFDQYQRYRLVADLARGLRGTGPPLHILDVGGRTGVLRRFLPEMKVSLVDLEESDEPGLVLATGDQLPYKDQSFDLVCACDTLEHIPVAAREAFVSECWRVSKQHVILAGPYEHPRVDEAEEILLRFLQDKLGQKHRYLSEHRENGLPVLDQTEAQFRSMGAGQTTAIGHGELDRWLALMPIALYLDHDPPLRKLATRLHRFYNSALYAGDRPTRPDQDVYRHALIASRSETKLPTADELFGPPGVPAGTLEPFRELVDNMLAFDIQKDAVESERERLHEVCSDLEKDLNEHKESIETVTEDLDGHKGLVSHYETINAALEVDLTEHAESLKAMKADMKQHLIEQEASLAELSEDLEGHKGVLAHLETVRDALDKDLTEHKGSLADFKLEFEARGAVLEEIRVELADEQEQSSKVQTELAAALERGEVAARDLIAKDELITHMRAEMRSRVKNMKRALALKKPEV
ncbi:MAG: ubiquinone/menaquinone biosynthesis C-methylase UbiE [Planctomycetota bacterium]|jgi:ubiquinone/menaquinone biosynthesis C-methylase UbiE